MSWSSKAVVGVYLSKVLASWNGLMLAAFAGGGRGCWKQWLQALSYALSPPKEIAIVGEPDGDDTRSFLAFARDGYRPFQVLAPGAPSIQPSTVPLLQDHGPRDGQVAAYVCRNLA
jgi:uncharacterized protein YyaL (SSP411 family)